MRIASLRRDTEILETWKFPPGLLLKRFERSEAIERLERLERLERSRSGVS